jgi:hypothetical protein
VASEGSSGEATPFQKLIQKESGVTKENGKA